MSNILKREDAKKISPEQFDNLRSHYYGVCDHLHGLQGSFEDLKNKPGCELVKKLMKLLDDAGLGYL